MTNLEKEIMNYLIALRFYLYTDGDEGGMSKKDRSDTTKKIISFNKNNKEWLETNHDFDLRLFNIPKYLRILLNKDLNKKYIEEVILERDIEYLERFPVQVLIYNTYKLRNLIINKDSDLVNNFNIMIKNLSELFEYLEKNPNDAKIYFAILIGIFCQIDQVCIKKENMQPNFHSATEIFYLSEYYNAIYDNKKEKIFVLNLIDNIKDSMRSIFKLLGNKDETNYIFSDGISESLNLIKHVLSNQVADFQLSD